MDLTALNRMLGDRPIVEYVNALIDEDQLPALMAQLKNLPAVSTVALKQVAVSSFHEIVAASLMVFVGFFSAFSLALVTVAVIAAGLWLVREGLYEKLDHRALEALRRHHRRPGA